MTDSTPNDFVRAWRTATDADVARGLANPADYTSEALETLQSEARRRGIAVGDVRPQSPLEDSVYLRLVAPIGRYLWIHRPFTAFLLAAGLRAWVWQMTVSNLPVNPMIWSTAYFAILLLCLGLLALPLRSLVIVARVTFGAFLGHTVVSAAFTFRMLPVIRPGPWFWVFLPVGFVLIGWAFPFTILACLVKLRNRYRPIYPPGHCRKCGYDLQGLPEPRCPECGKPFEFQEA